MDLLLVSSLGRVRNSGPTEMTEVFAWWLVQVGSAILILVETYVH